MFMKIHGAMAELIDRASKKDISFLIKCIAISIFIVAVGVACCLVMYGSVEVDLKTPATLSK